MKMLLGALATVMLVGAVAVQPAEARCWSNGVAVACVNHAHPYWRNHWHHGWDRWHHGW